jgi:hypothetical protein
MLPVQAAAARATATASTKDFGRFALDRVWENAMTGNADIFMPCLGELLNRPTMVAAAPCWEMHSLQANMLEMSWRSLS